MAVQKIRIKLAAYSHELVDEAATRIVETMKKVEVCRNAAGKTIWHPRYCKSTWHDFCSKADFEYDNGYGAAEIPMDLIVVGKDFWLERHDYDGSEWWEFKTMPEEPEETTELNLKAEFQWVEI